MEKVLSSEKRAAVAILNALKRSIVKDFSDGDAFRLMTQICKCAVNAANERDFVNYDKALAILGMKTNRQRLNELCKANGIKNVRFNNTYIGFPRKDIEALAKRLKHEKGG